MTESCRDCHYWTTEPRDAVGLCQRYPTRIRKAAGEWCGEYKWSGARESVEGRNKAIQTGIAQALDDKAYRGSTHEAVERLRAEEDEIARACDEAFRAARGPLDPVLGEVQADDVALRKALSKPVSELGLRKSTALGLTPFAETLTDLTAQDAEYWRDILSPSGYRDLLDAVEREGFRFGMQHGVTEYPHRVRWSKMNDPTSFEPRAGPPRAAKDTHGVHGKPQGAADSASPEDIPVVEQIPPDELTDPTILEHGRSPRVEMTRDDLAEHYPSNMPTISELREHLGTLGSYEPQGCDEPKPEGDDA